MTRKRTSACSSNQAGMVLIEVMVAVSILSILIYGFLTMFDVQYRQLKGLNQRIETTELRSLTLQSLAKPDTCSWQLQGQSIDLSTVTTTTASPTVIDLNELYMGPAGSPLLAQKGALLPGTQSDVVVSSIQFKNIVSTGNPGEYVGSLQIDFDPSHLVSPLKPIVIRKIVSVDTVTSKITACGPPAQTTTRRYCNTYGAAPDYASANATDKPFMCDPANVDADPATGYCHIENSENAMGCFLTGVDDDTGSIIVKSADPLHPSYSSNGYVYDSVTVPVDAGSHQKCEIDKDSVRGGWRIRSWFTCELVTCKVTCIFNP